MFVPQVDRDGNETSGIRLPVIQVPLGTYSGWNLRDPTIGAPDELYSMVGSYIAFPRTKAGKGKPRRSDEHPFRSGTRIARSICRRSQQAARQLAADRYVLERDIPRIVEKAAAQWDYTMKPD